MARTARRYGLLAAVLVAAALLRATGLDWDDGTYPHPDERFLVNVTHSVHSGALKPTERDESARAAHLAGCRARYPASNGVGGWFDTACSDFNPANVGIGGYAYGQLPLAAVRFLAEGTAAVSGWPGHRQYGGLHVVGRAYSAAVDVLTTLVVFLLGRLLWGRRAGLLGAAFYAVAVLPIQSSHFWTVDTTVTLFTTLAILFAARLARYARLPDALALGVAIGLATASKVSAAPLVALVPLAAVLAARRTLPANARRLSGALGPLPALVLAAVGALAAFRVASPYAFAGPDWMDLALSPAFLQQIDESRRLASGVVDFPPNWQWLDRTSWLFPGANIALWGLGLPLAAAALAGLAHAGRRLLRATPIEAVRAIPWLWTLGYFLWMGQQWVCAMRYFLPLYPLLCLFAAAWLATWRRRRRWTAIRSGRPGTLAPTAAIAGVLALTSLWALAFHSIYTTLHPYVAASQWALRHIPAAVSAPLVTESRTTMLVNWPSAGTIGEGAAARSTVDTRAPASGTIDRLRLYRYARAPAATPATIEARVRDAAGATIARTEARALPAIGGSGAPLEVELPLIEPARLAGGAVYRLELDVSGGPITLAGATIASEGAWNDAVPTRGPWPRATDVPDLRGPSGTTPRGAPRVDPFGERYFESADLLLIGEDDDAKRARIEAGLAAADWVIVPNNRFYDSITRNPLRFPLTTRYYDALFAGELGFARVLTVASLPRFGPLAFDDQALPAPGEGISAPGRHRELAAEEAFSVYDHPTVFVFHKRSDYSRERVAAAFAGIDLTTVEAALRSPLPAPAGRLAWSTLAADAAPDGLLLSPEVLRANAQRAPPGEASPTPQWLAVLLWYALALVFAAIAWPWLAAAWPGLPDRGYGVARIAGLASAATLAWWLASNGIGAWSAAGLGACAAALLVAALVVAGALQRRDPGWLRACRRDVVLTEAIFAGLFAIGLLLRMLDPDLWAPALGGEKPMDYAMFNSILATTSFPPPDAWFSDGRVNYYYFGWVIAATLAKLTGAAPGVAYNLALATCFALTGVAAFALASNACRAATTSIDGLRRARLAGAVALAAAVLLGNLDLPRALAANTEAVGAILSGATPSTRESWGDALTRRSERWLWAPSRTVGERPGSSFEVNEFPAFSFLYGDLHPHVMALPLQLFALTALLALALPVFRTAVEAAAEAPRAIAATAVAAVGVAWLRMTNTWDWPLHLTLAGAAVAIAGWRAFGQEVPLARRAIAPSERALRTLLLLLFLVALQAAIAAPFNAHLATGPLGLRWYEGTRTTLGAWLAVQGWFVAAIVAWATLLERDSPALSPARRTPAARALAGLRGIRWLGIGYTVAMAVAVLYRGQGEVPAPGAQIALLAWLGELAWRNLHRRTELAGLALAIVGFGVALVVEWIVVGLDMGRMNTYFKLHLQSWLLLAVASGIAVSGVASAAVPLRGARILRAGFAVLTILAAAYLPLATYGRAHSRFVAWTPPTLDGEAFLHDAVHHYNGTRLALAGDAAIIGWLRAHAGPHDVVVEAQLPEYRWGSRISSFTGRPTLLGYRYHQTQQRPVPALADAIELRKRNVAAIYESTDAATALALLRHYGARFVVVGGLERASYPAPGLAKFAALATTGDLEIAWRSGDDVIYRVASDRPRNAPIAPRW